MRAVVAVAAVVVEESIGDAAAAAVGTKAVVVEESIGDAAVGAKAVEEIGNDAAAVEEEEDSGENVRGREMG